MGQQTSFMCTKDCRGCLMQENSHPQAVVKEDPPAYANPVCKVSPHIASVMNSPYFHLQRELEAIDHHLRQFVKDEAIGYCTWVSMHPKLRGFYTPTYNECTRKTIDTPLVFLLKKLRGINMLLQNEQIKCAVAPDIDLKQFFTFDEHQGCWISDLNLDRNDFEMLKNFQHIVLQQIAPLWHSLDCVTAEGD